MSEDIETQLRQLPSVDRLLNSAVGADLVAAFGRPLTVEGVRSVLDQRRAAIINGKGGVPMNAVLLAETREWLESLIAPTLRPVINATGVIVHTNLGRAPLSADAISAVHAAAAGYSNLEYDLEAGERGSRTVHAAVQLQRLTGAESALVVNNNAAAVLLMLTALCQGREAIISRGQLVEIGGGFRVPDVMAQSGAKLVEVGTTNRTHLRDYANVINENTAAILIAHHSNYKIIGFTTEPETAELAVLAQEKGILLLYDQGSGAMIDTEPFGLSPEPTITESLEAGVDVVAFSGDKLLGGPQAGILCGKADHINKLKKHPLARAVRADKLCLAALSATLTHYLTGKAVKEVPVWQMIARPLEQIKSEADSLAVQWQEMGLNAAVIDGQSTVGGGSLPGTSMPTYLVAIESENLEDLSAFLRANAPPIIGRIRDGRLLFDLRTILYDQRHELARGVVECWNKIEEKKLN
jgi:L-seryl-tRNA(Ser) seleniumtransferase